MLPKRRTLLLTIAYLAFVSLGLPDAVLGVAWPSIRQTFTLPQSGLGMVLVAAGTGYFVSSFSMGALLQRLGVGALLAISTFFLAISLSGYALTPNWLLFLGFAVLAGMGSGAIDGGLNAYAAHYFSSRHMNWLHASYGLGAMLGPLIMTSVLDAGAVWRWGYAIVAGCQLLMVLAFVATRHRWQNGEIVAEETAVSPTDKSMRAALRHPIVWLQIGLFFLYTGLEVSAGQWSFTLFTEGRGVAVTTAGLWVSGYWASLTAGRVGVGVLVEWIPITRLLRLSMTGMVVGTVLILLQWGTAVNFFGLALLGLSLAPIFPLLMTQTPARVGRHLATHAVGFQVSAATLGVMVLPATTGLLVQWTTLEAVGVMLVVLAVALLSLHEILLARTGPTAVQQPHSERY